MGTISKKIKVVFFHRKPRALGNFSIETYFEQIRKALPDNFEPVYCEMPYESNGLFKRLYNSIYCVFKQGDINHITGDIHYISTFLKRQKTILTVLDCGMLHQSSGIKHKIFKLFWFTIPAIKSKLITVISEATKTDLLQFVNYDSDKVHVVHVSISDNFKRLDKPFNKLSPRILQIGTAENKNIKRLIPALKGIDCILVIIGKVSNELKLLIKENNVNCEIFERKLSYEEMLEEYNKCDILTLVSTIEGFGMPIVEANAVGRVVIAANNSSMPEVAGKAACLVDADNIVSIHEGLKRVIDNANYRTSLINEGFENVKRFSVKYLANQYCNVYHELLNLEFSKN